MNNLPLLASSSAMCRRQQLKVVASRRHVLAASSSSSSRNMAAKAQQQLLLLLLGTATTTTTMRTAPRPAAAAGGNSNAQLSTYAAAAATTSSSMVARTDIGKIAPPPGLGMLLPPFTSIGQHQSSSLRNFSKQKKNKGARSGQHMQVLDELAHQGSREEAEERRRRKKEKKIAKKGGSKVATVDDDEDDDLGSESDGEGEGEDQQPLPDPAAVRSEMERVVERYVEQIKAIRGAEPTPEMFDDVQVDAYGDASTPLPAVAQVVIQSPTLATATCYDPTLAQSVCKAIGERLELNPSAEGDDGVVRIPIPRVSAETRKQLTKELNKRAEKARQAVRSKRQHAMKVVKRGVKGNLEHVSKDAAFDCQNEIEEITEEMVGRIDEATNVKHDSIMAV